MPSTEKSTSAETASVRSTSTVSISSLKALLPRKTSKDVSNKEKSLAGSARETPEEKALRREAVAGYMSIAGCGVCRKGWAVWTGLVGSGLV
ncbi:hypothetical protein PV04_10444 [Phialophora macrospora]|uniref:Uncharacterized protein n=1 Tax=Phialophora macrospora TaxID=1851006 RepID=A0A0D2CB82_9EURO|nr:hypothetical protein PV04_10444 [Phialophora macrospora]